MRARAFACLLSFGVVTGQAGTELHVSKVGEAPEFVGLRFAGEIPPLRLEAFTDHVRPATALPDVRQARLFGEPAEAGQPPRDLGEIELPANGRHLLLLSQVADGKVRTKLLPFDQASLPVGGVLFLNLTSRRMRCFVDGESVELSPEEAKRLPTASPARRIVSHRLELKTKDGWKADSSTTLILGARRRFVFVLQEDSPRSPLRRAAVTDFDPERNLAPLEPVPVKAAPPLPDPPAK
jgi:hypothetical protein